MLSMNGLLINVHVLHSSVYELTVSVNTMYMDKYTNHFGSYEIVHRKYLYEVIWNDDMAIQF